MRAWIGPAAAAALLGACGAHQDETADTPVRAPMMLTATGAASGAGVDAADRDCSVVLRSVGRIRKGPGYETTCDRAGGAAQGPCLYLWDGIVEVGQARNASSASVAVLYRTNSSQGVWQVAKATADGPAANGVRSYRFTIDRFTPAVGMSLTSLNRAVIDLIPYVEDKLGGRLFDHNRVADALDSYHLTLSNSWQIDDDTAICPRVNQTKIPTYALTHPGWGETLHDGPVRAGGELRIRYDGRRLRETQGCMGSKGPVSATTVRVGYRIDAGAVASEVVEQYVVSYGGACSGGQEPCIKHDKLEPTIAIPAGASSIAMWFYCVPGFGNQSPGHWRYDSNLGRNYKLSIASTPTTRRSIDWAGGWRLHAARSGFTFALPDPYVYKGFTNMGFSMQFEVYAKGLSDRSTIDTQRLKAYVESDLLSCRPGGAIKRQELKPAGTNAGPFRNNALYRWGVESSLLRCPKGHYRFRMLLSADGGATFTTLGNAQSTASPNAGGWRTIESI